MLKSPFKVYPNFIPLALCDQLVDNMGIVEPDTDPNDKPIKTIRAITDRDEFIFDALESIQPELEEYYGFNWKGIEVPQMEFYPEECVDASTPSCGNSVFVSRKWVRNKHRDLTGILFLSDYNEGEEAFDPQFEVYGGKLQFPQHKFSFNPKRGTLVVFPASPHFINVVSNIMAGDLFMMRFHIATEQPFLYDPSQFRGDYKHWFKDM